MKKFIIVGTIVMITAAAAAQQRLDEPVVNLAKASATNPENFRAGCVRELPKSTPEALSGEVVDRICTCGTNVFVSQIVGVSTLDQLDSLFGKIRMDCHYPTVMQSTKSMPSAKGLE
jgi:hypothetical protein